MKNDLRITEKDVLSSIINLKQLTFEVTDACNLKCKYCSYGDLYVGYDRRKSTFMTFEQGRIIIDYLIKIWEDHSNEVSCSRTYVSFYGGEPLLNMSFISQIIEYIESLKINREFIFSMTTNGVLLNLYMDFLVQKNVRLLISLDGDKKCNSYRITPKGESSFEQIMQNIRSLQNKHPLYFEKYVNFNSVLNNRSDVDTIVEFFQNTFNKIPNISELNNSSINPNRWTEFKDIYRSKDESMVNSSYCKSHSEELLLVNPQTYNLAIFLHQHTGNAYNDYNHLITGGEKVATTPTGTCIPFSKRMFINVNGKILPCEKIGHKYALGQIHDNKVIINTKEIAQYFNSLLDKVQHQCLICAKRRSCSQCLFYINDIDSTSPICQGFMNKDDFDQYASSCLEHLSKNPGLYKKIMTEVQID